MGNDKARAKYFATIIYPESAPENFRDIISSWNVRAYLSPLHDKDLVENKKSLKSKNTTSEGQYKKKHLHCLVLMPSLKSKAQMKFLFSQVGGVGLEIVNDPILYARYLCHIDHPQKARYSEDDVVSFGNIPYKDYIKQKSDNASDINAVFQLCQEHDIMYFSDLLDYVRTSKPEYFDTVVKYTYLFYSYLKSKLYSERTK